MHQPNIAVVYQTVEGHTTLIAERIAEVLRSNGATVRVFNATNAPAEMTEFDAFVVGGSIHLGRHDKKLAAFVKSHVDVLNARPAAFFSVSMTAAHPDEKHLGELRPIVDKFFADTGWHPGTVEFVGGEVAYTKYNFLTRFIMKRISRKEGGETDTSRDWDYTDWAAVDAFAKGFAQRVASTAA